MTKGNSIYNEFENSMKKLPILTKYQKEKHDRGYALILGIDTRWGTQYSVLNSLKRSKEALELNSERGPLDSKDGAIFQTLGDVYFGAEVDELLGIIQPVHVAQVMSESSKSHLNYV